MMLSLLFVSFLFFTSTYAKTQPFGNVRYYFMPCEHYRGTCVPKSICPNERKITPGICQRNAQCCSIKLYIYRPEDLSYENSDEQKFLSNKPAAERISLHQKSAPKEQNLSELKPTEPTKSNLLDEAETGGNKRSKPKKKKHKKSSKKSKAHLKAKKRLKSSENTKSVKCKDVKGECTTYNCSKPVLFENATDCGPGQYCCVWTDFNKSGS